MTINILVLPLGLLGFIISWYIYYKKARNENLVCLIGQDCNKVLNSKYNKTFGLPNELLGMLYYGAVVLFMLVLLFGFNQIGFISLFVFLIIIGGLAAVFSVILIFIQAFILKEWCEYCLASAAISILIFIIEII